MLAVLVHIQDHLDAELSLEALGKVAHLSPFHFHRIFTAFMGEGVKEHIRRLRLERAALALKSRDQTILDIALEAGFQSHEAFTRAFRAMFGCTPSNFRHSNHWQKSPSRTAPLEGAHPGLLPTSSGNPPMTMEIKEMPTLRLAFARGNGTYAKAAETAWSQLCAWAGPKGLLGPQTLMIGICHDDPQITQPDKIRYDAAIPVPDAIQANGPISIQELKGGRYATLIHKGPYERLHESWNLLVAEIMPKKGHKLRNTPSFEIYLNDPSQTAPEELLTEIYAPMED